MAEDKGREVRVLTYPATDAASLRVRFLARWRIERLESRFENVPLP
jgi:hypothetical protein